MPDLHFRAMTPADLEAVVSIERASMESPWERRGFAKRLAKKKSRCYVATDGDQVVAYAALAFEEGRAHLLNFAVAPPRRRQGIGREFTQFLMNVCSMLELSRLVQEVRETNLGAQLFYRSLDLRATKVLRKFYEDTGEDAYRMEREVETPAPQIDR